MSFITRCTSCSTLFKVVADQLKISDGWVRCGQCATVFDAQAHLVDSASEASAPVPVHPHNMADTGFRSSESNVIAAESPSSHPSHERDPQALGLNPFVPTSEQEAASIFPAVGIAGRPASDSEEPTTVFPVSVSDESLLPEPTSDLNVSTQQGAADTLQVEPGFIAQARRAQRWRSPWMRLGLSGLALFLTAGLALQVVIHDKDLLAAQWPKAKPWLTQVCAYAGCKVQALQRIEAIAVDASSFNRMSKSNAAVEAITQSYRLSVTLKNTGHLPLALPHVELSLQDAQDQPILRRVLSPADLGSNLAALAPAQNMAGLLTLQIDTAQLAGRKIQGYRVLAFYPSP